MSQAAVPKRRRWLKALGFVAVFLVLALGVLVAFAPAIISGFVPGIVKSTASKSIAGQVTVGSAHLSWGGPIKIGAIEVKDPAGAHVATVNAEISAGLWQLMKGLDLGTVTVSGKADLVRRADGTTNLQSAIASPAGRAPTSKPIELPQGLNARIVLKNIDVSYKDLDAAGATANTASLKNLRGEASVTSAAGTSPAKASVDLGGSVGDGQSSSGSFKLNVKLSNFTDAQGRLTPQTASVDATVDAGNMPVALVDALANLRGTLLDTLGPTATASITVKGDATTGNASINIKSQNTTADLALRMADGKLTAERPGSVSMRTLGFLNKMPAMRDGLANAGITLTQWPALDAKIHSLALPFAKAGGAISSNLSGIGIDVEVKTTGITGRLQPKPAEGQPPARPQAFAVMPATITIKSPDLATGASLIASTSATLDNQSAGAVNVDIQATELLDANGQLVFHSGIPGRITGNVTATGVSTALAAPFLGADSLIDLSTDVGPTVDMTARFAPLAEAGGAATTGGIPSIDADVSVTSNNLKLTAPVRFADGVVSSRADITANIAASAGILRRVIEKSAAGQSPAARIDGDGRFQLTVSDLRVPMKVGGSQQSGLDLASLAMTARAKIELLDVLPKGSNAGSIQVQEVTVEARLQPGQPARLGAAGTLAHEQKPFGLQANLTFPNLSEALASKAPDALIPGIGLVRVEGSIELTDMPASLARFAPAARSVAASGKTENVNLLGELTSGLIGDRATLKLTLQTATDGGQSVTANVNGAGIRADVAADLSATQLRVSSLAADATVRPETVRGVLRAIGQDQGNLANIATRGPAKIGITGDPITIPLARVDGKLIPDVARASTTEVRITIAEPLIVSGIPAGDRTLTGGVRDFEAAATLPLASLLGNAKDGEPLRAVARGKLLLDEGRPIGDLTLNATTNADRSALDAVAEIKGLDTAAVDGMLDRRGMISGALGPTADVSVSVRQDLGTTAAANASDAPRPLRAKVQVTNSQRLRTDPLDVIIDADRIALAAPAKVAWTLDPVWADRYLLAPDEGKPQSYRLIGDTALAMDIRKLSISRPESRGGLTITGPLKPGVFNVDLTASAPRVQVVTLGEPGGEGPVSLDNVVAEIKTAADNILSLNIRSGVAAAQAGQGAASEPVTVVGTVRDLALGGGVFNKEGYAADLDMRAPSVPTALVDAVAGMNGRLVDLLGPQLRATLNTRNLSPREGSSGQIALDFRSFRPPTPEHAALVTLTAPIRDGLVMTSTSTGAVPLRVELAEFNVGEKDTLVQSLGIIATMSKPRTDAQGKPNPAVITSSNLTIPLNPNRGNLRRMNGDIDVSLGTVNYTMRSGFASLIQSGALKDFLARDAKQPPMKPFRVIIREGVAEYQGVEIPLKVSVGFGEEIVYIPVGGKVNLVDRTLDMEVDLPLELVSGSVLSLLPIGFGDIQKSMVSILGGSKKDPTPAEKEEARKARAVRIPVHVHGPMDKPKFDVRVDLFGLRNKNFDPGKALQNIGDAIKDIGDLFKKPKK